MLALNVRVTSIERSISCLPKKSSIRFSYGPIDNCLYRLRNLNSNIRDGVLIVLEAGDTASLVQLLENSLLSAALISNNAEIIGVANGVEVDLQCHCSQELSFVQTGGKLKFLGSDTKAIKFQGRNSPFPELEIAVITLEICLLEVCVEQPIEQPHTQFDQLDVAHCKHSIELRSRFTDSHFEVLDSTTQGSHSSQNLSSDDSSSNSSVVDPVDLFVERIFMRAEDHRILTKHNSTNFSSSESQQKSKERLVRRTKPIVNKNLRAKHSPTNNFSGDMIWISGPTIRVPHSKCV